MLLKIGTVQAQVNSNKGVEFWVPYMAHITPAGNDPTTYSSMYLYITSDVNTEGQVEIADGSFTRSFRVQANKVTFVKVPPSAFINTEGKFLKGIHITSQRPIVVYAHIFAESISGATLVLPVNTLSNDYFAVAYTQASSQANGSYSVFTVIATEGETAIEITPAEKLMSGNVAGRTFSINLQKGEIYQALSKKDLTGSRIRSVSSRGEPCKKIAVFSGSNYTSVGCTPLLTSDNLFQQAYPTRSWGRAFVTVPLKNRPFDVYRILVRDASTQVKRNGVNLDPGTLVNGFYYEFIDTMPNLIAADQPIQVVQYAITQHATLDCGKDESDLSGDPEMIFLTPIEQNISEVTFYSPTNSHIQQHYVNINIPTEAAPSFRLDGAVPLEKFKPVPGNPSYVYGQFKIDSGTHHIEADQGFNAIAYGFGVYESYGYSAGTNMRDLRQYNEMIDLESMKAVESGCVGDEFKARLVLPYQPTRIIWDFDNGSPPKIIDKPQYQSTFMKDGALLYVYEDSDEVIFEKVKSYFIKVSAYNPFGNDCGSIDELYYNFDIYESPTVDFLLPKICVTDSSAEFFDQSTTVDGSAARFTYVWDFGDPYASATNPNSSTDKNPIHRYTQAGNYEVSLSITSKSGCVSIAKKTLTVNGAVPKADFIILNQDRLCSNQEVWFKNTSTVDFGSITKVEFFYDYGDQPGIVEVDENPEFDKLYRHLYPKFQQPATKDVTVRMLSYSGKVCVDEVIKVITLKGAPVVDFTYPSKICQEASPILLTATPTDGYANAGVFSGNGVNSQGIFNPSVAGEGQHSISYIFMGGNGCLDTVSLTIQVSSSPIVSAGRDTVVLEELGLTLAGFSPVVGAQYKWTPATGLDRDDVLNPKAYPSADIVYRLTVTSPDGCSAFAEVSVKVLNKIIIPNTFSPNNDGINDLWNIKYLDTYPNCAVEVYNRYGEKLYSSRGYHTPWDGRNNGQDLPVGTYYYIINTGQERKVLSGAVTIIR